MSAASKNALCLYAALCALALSGCQRRSPAGAMRAIVPHTGRTLEARLTGVDWSPIRVQRATTGDPLDPARLELAGSAGAVIQTAANDRSPGARHDAGVAFLLIDRESDAVDALEAATQQASGDPTLWSDLSAARYALAVRGNAAYQLPVALANADRALRIDPNLPDALFNRALIIEHLGISEAARRAWHRYLQADSSSRWANEALQHLSRLRVVLADAVFARELDRATAALHRGDATVLAAITRTYPEQARRWGEALLLARWADALRSGRTAEAAEALHVVREISRALVATNGEHLLADAVDAVDHATPERVRALAEAHAIYREGRLQLRDGHFVESRGLLDRASSLFAYGKSPMSLVARFYAANTVYTTNRTSEASAIYRSLLSGFDTRRYPALYANIEWQVTLCAIALGSWPQAIEAAQESSRIFRDLGEDLNRGSAEDLLAEALDQVGQPHNAWAIRVGAFAALSRGDTTDRIRNVLAAAVRTEAKRGEYESALALSTITVDGLRSNAAPPSLAQAHAYHARLLLESGDPVAARRELAAARADQSRILDPDNRARVALFVDTAEAAIVRRSDPNHALALLQHAIEFASSHDDHLLPDLHLERGRTLLAAGRAEEALADFASGIRVLEHSRAAFDDRELRSGFYDTEPDLFAESIGILLSRNEPERAFALADGVRARTVQERLGLARPPKSQVATAEEIRGAMPANCVLLEYAMLRERMAIFYASANGFGVVEVPVDVKVLRLSIKRYRDLLEHRGDLTALHAASAGLRQFLIAPVADRLRGVRQLIVVPDRELHTIPFGALYDAAAHRYLVEDVALVTAPNAAFALRSIAGAPLAPALVIGDPANRGERALPEASREAEAIAAMYPSAILLTGERATRARVIDDAKTSGIIHYAGHARSDATTSSGTLRLAGSDLNAADVSALRLQKAPLVLLAACGTIRGDADHVEGMTSMAQAFLIAGAHSVIGTLWEIDDDTAANLFRRIHRQLRAGQPPAAALQAAQLELLRGTSAPLRHPSTWAPVEIIGNHH